jgi:cation:H+ antiporter
MESQRIQKRPDDYVLFIGLAGPVLTRYADVIARLTGLSRSWIGLVMLASATSLPELFTGLSAVIAAAAPNIAVGDALGSCVFNLAMLVLLDELSRREPMYRRIDQGHLLTAGFGIILIGSAGAFLLLSQSVLNFQLFHISGYTPFIIVLYFIAMRSAFVYERRTQPPPEPIAAESDIMLRTAFVRYSAAAASTDPPSLKWSDLKYVFWHQGGLRCRGSATSPRRSLPS